MSGARFVVLKGQLARLERALTQFMLDVQTEQNGYTEHATPILVRPHAMFGTGQLPKFEVDAFSSLSFDGSVVEDALSNIRASIESGRSYAAEIDTGNPHPLARSELDASVQVGFESLSSVRDAMLTTRYYLIPTAEVSLTNIYREQIVDAGTLPVRMTAATPCFRSEAGSAGRDTRGMIRQHQFIKVELVSITKPDDSEAEHLRMTKGAEGLLERLDRPGA